MRFAHRSSPKDTLIFLKIILFFLVLAVGCNGTGHEAEPSDAGDTEPGDIGPGDTGPDDPVEGEVAFDVTIELSEAIPTVAMVTWSAELERVDSGRVEFGLDTGYELVAPTEVEDEGSYQALLFGMKPSREYHLRVVATSDGQAYASEDLTVTTGPVPTSLPDLTVSISEAGSEMASGGYLVTSIFAVPPAAVIIDGDGDYVWWHIDSDPRFQVSRTRLSYASGWVFYWSGNARGPAGPDDPVMDQRLMRVSLDGTVVEEVGLEEGHHDFTILPDGTLAYIEYDERLVDGISVRGDRIIELRPDGTSEEVFSIWDHVEYRPTHRPGVNWSHANAIAYFAEEDVYYVSFRHFNSIYKIDRQTGDVICVMGGVESDFELPSGSTSIFLAQHGIHPLGDTLLVFDNGEESRHYSQLLEMSFNESTGIAETFWSFIPSPTIFNATLGCAQRLESGNTLATYSNAGQIEEVTTDGDVLWRLNASLGGATGYSQYMESLYETY